MIEVRGDLWTYPADARIITTNGAVRLDGQCVMGRGCAREARDAYPGIAKALGRMIDQHGNHVFLLRSGDPVILSFPVKHHWKERADLDLIERSALELVEVLNNRGMEKLSVVMPRPGCGNGSLDWEVVKPRIAPILDDRFKVITWL